MLHRFNRFINEVVQKDDIKEYFYDIIDCGAKYSLISLSGGGFYIKIYDYDNINDNIIKQGRMPNQLLESLIERLNNMENLNLTYSIISKQLFNLRQGANGRYYNVPVNGTVVFIFDAYLVLQYNDIFKDLQMKISSKGEEIFFKNKKIVLKNSKGNLHVIDDIWVQMKCPIKEAVIARIIYEEYGLKIKNALEVKKYID